MHERQQQLNGLLGIAVLVVVLHHWSLIAPGFRQQIDSLYLPRLLVAGPQAIVVTFVLSGFVLFQAWERYAGSGYLRWCGWRLARLGLPLVACVTFSAVLALLIGPRSIPQLSSWFNQDSWAAPVSWLEWLRNIAPLDGRANHQLDNVTWALVVELRCSLIFPLIALAIRRSWPATLLCCLLLSLLMPANPGNAFDLLWTLRYLFLFAAGAALALNRARLSQLASNEGKFPLAATLLFAGLWAIISDPRQVLAPMPLVSAGAILVLAVCAFDPVVGRFLRRPAIAWLGQISLSLYLVHLPVLLAMVHWLHARLPLAAITAASLPLTLAAAALLERWVERPAQRLGRHFLHRQARPPLSNEDRRPELAGA